MNAIPPQGVATFSLLSDETASIPYGREREFFFDNLLVRIYFIIEMIWLTSLVPRELEFTFSGSLTSTFQGSSFLFSMRNRVHDAHSSG